MTFDPASVEVLCVTLPKDHCVQVPRKYIKVCGYSDLFCKKNLNQRSLTRRWPLTPHLLRSHVWLYPRIIMSKSHENTSKYVDTVNLFAKTWTKGHWPLDDLWPHICWGHRCDSTQGSLCPSPMGIHQCIWIQWSILQKLPHTYTHIHTHTMYRISDHIVSFWTMFRRDNKSRLTPTCFSYNLQFVAFWWQCESTAFQSQTDIHYHKSHTSIEHDTMKPQHTMISSTDSRFFFF